MGRGRRGLRWLVAFGLLGAAVPAANAGPGHGNVFRETPRGIPADATVSAFADAPAFLAAEVLIQNGPRIQVCAYTVTDVYGVPIGVRTIAAAYWGVDPAMALTDDVFTKLEPSGFIYTRETSWAHQYRLWNALRLYVDLPRIGGFLELFVASEAPGTLIFASGQTIRHGFEALVVTGHRRFDGMAASLGEKVGTIVDAAWGTQASGGCWASYPDPGQVVDLVS